MAMWSSMVESEARQREYQPVSVTRYASAPGPELRMVPVPEAKRAHHGALPGATILQRDSARVAFARWSSLNFEVMSTRRKPPSPMAPRQYPGFVVLV